VVGFCQYGFVGIFGLFWVVCFLGLVFLVRLESGLWCSSMLMGDLMGSLNIAMVKADL